MNDDLVKKSLVFGMIVLFIGTVIVPTNAGIIRRTCIENSGTVIEIATGQPGQENCTLTVNYMGDGNGIVNRTPPGVENPDDTITYPCGTNVTLFAISEYGSEFAGWSGDLTGTGHDNPNWIIMDGNKTINATFNLEEFRNCLGTVKVIWNYSAFYRKPGTDADWREDPHYFFKKISDKVALGNFTVECYTQFIVGGPIARPNRFSGFEIILFDPVDDHIIGRPYERWSKVPNGHEDKMVLIIEKMEFDFDDLNMEEGQNEKEIGANFQGYGFPFFYKLFPPNPISYSIVVHFL